MKKTFNILKAAFILAMIIGWTSCEFDSYLSNDDKFDVSISENSAVPGGEIAYKTGDNDFALKFSPTSGTMKSTEAFTGDFGFWIGETEVTYGLYAEVRDWSQDNGYSIGSKGYQSTIPEDEYPAAHLNWFDAVVWCNALTEYYNEYNGDKPDYGIVYTANGDPIRDSDMDNADFENMDDDYTATGFRLPLNDDWYTAAKYKNTPDTYASGATDDCDNKQAVDKVAWYKDNSNNEPHPVAQKLANTLDLYDMSGNVREIMSERTNLFDGKCNTRGGGYQNSADNQAIGETVLLAPNGESGSLGFRLARTLGDDEHEDIEKEENEDDENEAGEGAGYFMFNGTKYDIASGVIKNYNHVGMQLLELHLFSEDIVINTDNNGHLGGTGDMMTIGLYCSDEDLEDGKTYTEDNCLMVTINAMMNLNADIFPWEPENGFIGHDEMTLSVTKKDDVYTLEFSCKGADYTQGSVKLDFDGEYEGELPILTAGIDF